MESAEVVVGTYENLILGFHVMKNLRKDASPYGLETSFTNDAHRGALRCMTVSANGILASSSTDDSVRLHSLRRRKEIGSLFEHNGTVNCLTFFERSFMFSASEDGKICMWKTKNWEMLKALKGHKSQVLSVAVHPSGKLALSVGSDKSLLTWDLVTGKLAFQRKIKEAAQQILFTTDGNHYILVYQRSIEVCSIQDTKVVKETELNWRINALCHIQDDIFAVGGDDRHVFLLDVVSGNKLLTLDMADSGKESDFSGRVKCVCAIKSEDGPIVFVGTSSGTIRAFSVCINEGQETSEELMSYNANVRMTCMAVYSALSTLPEKENLSTNGQKAEEKAEDGDDEVQEEASDDENDVVEEDGDEDDEENDDDEKEIEPAPPKKMKKESKVQKKPKKAMKMESKRSSSELSRKQKAKNLQVQRARKRKEK